MNENDKLRAQVHDCGQCLECFLLHAVDAQPDLEEHAGSIREHLEAVRNELDAYAGVCRDKNGHTEWRLNREAK